MNVKWDDVHNNARNMSRKKFLRWIYELPDEIGCQKCRDHMREYLSLNPPEFHEDLLRWSWEFHNDVNEKLGKNKFSYDDFIYRYN